MVIRVVVPKESAPGEARVALTPSTLTKINRLGVMLAMTSGAGSGIFASDADYKNVEIAMRQTALLKSGDVVLKVVPPTLTEVMAMQPGAILISFLYAHERPDVVQALQQQNITAFAMELVPRISRAQDMDALSSQATIAGYKAVLIAANTGRFFFPMLTTAAGSVRPAKVLIIGAGVAGLQAIATARRLGAVVEAYDVRPETKEQVESLGAKFVTTGVSAMGAGGYARELTTEEREQQQEVLQKQITASDVVITTAGVPGRPAPRIVSKTAVEKMKAGAIIVDIMAENGGNCELSRAGEMIVHSGVTIIGTENICSSLAQHASEMYARNVINLLGLMIKDGALNLDWNDEILKGAIVTRDGKIVNEMIAKILGEKI